MFRSSKQLNNSKAAPGMEAAPTLAEPQRVAKTLLFPHLSLAHAQNRIAHLETPTQSDGQICNNIYVGADKKKQQHVQVRPKIIQCLPEANECWASAGHCG